MEIDIRLEESNKILVLLLKVECTRLRRSLTLEEKESYKELCLVWDKKIYNKSEGNMKEYKLRCDMKYDLLYKEEASFIIENNRISEELKEKKIERQKTEMEYKKLLEETRKNEANKKKRRVELYPEIMPLLKKTTEIIYTLHTQNEIEESVIIEVKHFISKLDDDIEYDRISLLKQITIILEKVEKIYYDLYGIYNIDPHQMYHVALKCKHTLKHFLFMKHIGYPKYKRYHSILYKILDNDTKPEKEKQNEEEIQDTLNRWRDEITREIREFCEKLNIQQDTPSESFKLLFNTSKNCHKMTDLYIPFGYNPRYKITHLANNKRIK
jgi:hypothetical protein